LCWVRPYSEAGANLLPPKVVPITKIIPSYCCAKTPKSAYTSTNSYRNYEKIPPVQKPLLKMGVMAAENSALSTQE